MLSKETLVTWLLRLKEWSSTNPKKAFCLVMLFLYIFGKYIKNKLKKPINLKNKVVFITGGASGIGRLVALRLKQLKCIVIICDINKNNLNEMSNHVDMAEYCDVSNYQSVKELALKIENKYNSVDILINNAGIVIAKRLEELNEKMIRKVFDVNILSHFWTIKSFINKMKLKNSGHIVTIASASGVCGVPLLTDYSSSKFACRGLDQSLKRELLLDGYNGIKFTCVNPYFIDTGMFNGVKHSSRWILRQISYLLDPDYVANEIVNGILYNKRDIRLPHSMAFTMSFEHILPMWLQDWVIINTCDLEAFKGH